MVDTLTIQQIIHEFLMLTGILAWFAIFVWLLYWSTGDNQEQSPSLQLTVLDSDLSKDDCISCVTFSGGTRRFGDSKSIADWLDDAIEPRAKLQYIHRRICERAGIDPGIMDPLSDLITEAVYDGFRRNACIQQVEEAIEERNQHSA